MAFNLLQIDRDLATNNIELVLGSGHYGTTVKFQFPPSIKSDNKAANWMEKDYKGAEPLALYMGAKAREVKLSWSYVVTGGTWDIKKISNIVKNIRKFYYQSFQLSFTPKSDGDEGSAVGTSGDSSDVTVIVKFRAYDVVGSNNGDFTFRSDSINVSHSSTLIKNDGLIYPLRTDLSMSLKLWTNMEYENNEGKKVELQGLKSLSDLKDSTPDWY